MPVAAGSQRIISHVKEAVIGTDPGTAYTIDRFLAGARLHNGVDDFTSDELRSDRAVASGVLGARHCKASLPFEFSSVSFNDWIESAMCNAWVAASTPNAGISTTVVAGVTNTMAGTSIGTGIAIGDWVKISGFTAGNAGNNGFWRCTAQSANLLTFGEAVDAASTSRLTACASQAGIGSVACGYITPGTTEKSVSLEFANPDVSVFQRGVGMEVNTMSLSIKQGAMITGSFEAIGFNLPPPAAVKYRTGSDVAAQVTMPFTSYNASSFLFVDGVPAAICTGVDLTLDNGMAELLPVFQTSLYDILLGRSNMTGSLTLAFTSSTYMAKALANTHITLRIQILDAAGSGYAIDVPNIRLKAPSENTSENQIFHTYAFQAEKDATTGTLPAGVVNCKIAKLV